MSKKIEWRTERRKVNDLIPYSKNPRVISEEQMKGLKRSLKKFNLAEIPAINADGTLLAGHQRMKALQSLGRGEDMIEVRIPNRQLSEAEARDYLLTSNRSGGSWDWEKLAVDFDIGEMLTAGFDSADFSRLIDDSLEVEDDDWNEEEEIKKVKIPTVKRGDFWQLGDHKLGCIDGTDEKMVRKLVGKERIDFVDVDSPFNIHYNYKGTNDKYGGIEKDNRTPDEFREFLRSLIKNSIAVSKESAHYIFWCDERWVFLLQELYQELNIISKRLCIWVKDNGMPTPKVAFNKATEFAVYGTRGVPFINDQIKNLNTIMNKEVSSGARVIDDIMDLYSIWLVKRLPTAQYLHPTQKNPILHEKALRRCTRPGDTVLDLTAGSGSLMVACDALKRRAFLAEIDPLFATLIKNRYEKISGKKARKLN